ncbi:4-hydroxybenzoate polyprenyltransferase-like prenyltransferase [Frankia canadensis]|uniref:4-hydroxybenzoate polyprenyltransferase-like prenyltransferase n=1 Tax=Frankia canadensis TaxID=1836972 RepID=A0A2I2KRK8_9ACTN|nr:4-hydroxybenzoate polyprenyltransferase-like prenyltransferase [Frankia canadensis]SOU55597.1 4-hydroxybenzoate polyprenyltransferase-like prenyltransferase [Frankia canadensis]
MRACHPEPTAAVTLFSAALAASSGRTARGVGLVASAVLAGQLSVGWSNDLVDRHRDAAGGRADKPLVGDGLTPATVAAATATALVACVPLSLACGRRAGFTHLAAVASAWGYNLGLKATPLSVVPYAVSFALLPTFVVQGLPGAPAPPWWLPAAASLLGAGAHFANVLPDLDADARTGVRGLPQRLGAAGSRGSAALLLAAGSAVAALGPARPWGLRVGVLAAVGVLTSAGLRRDDRTAFRTAMAVAAIDVALVVAGARLD